MEKSIIIEKLFFDILLYSYLLLPLSFILIGKEIRKEVVSISICIYGLVCFLFLFFYDSNFPAEKQKYLLSAYTFFEYSIFTFIFWINIRSQKIRSAIAIVSILFLIFQIAFVTLGKVQRLDSVPVGIETILLLTYVIYYFYQFSKNNTDVSILNHYIFWISLGILIYLGGSFFFFILINHLTIEEVRTFGKLTYIAEIIKNVFFVIALVIFSQYKKKEKKETLNSIPNLDMI